MIEMSAVLPLWIVGGVLAVLASMIVVLIVARSLDGSQAAGKQQFAAKLSELAQKATRDGQTGASPAWVSKALTETLTSFANASKDTRGDPAAKDAATAGQRQIKAMLAGLAVVGVIIAMIVKAIVGHGS